VLCSDGVHGALESAGLFGRMREARKQATPPGRPGRGARSRSPWPAAPEDNSTVVVVRCLCPRPSRESIWKKDILAWMKRKPDSSEKADKPEESAKARMTAALVRNEKR
jgi:hypothetical protein